MRVQNQAPSSQPLQIGGSGLPELTKTHLGLDDLALANGDWLRSVGRTKMSRMVPPRGARCPSSIGRARLQRPMGL